MGRQCTAHGSVARDPRLRSPRTSVTTVSLRKASAVTIGVDAVVVGIQSSGEDVVPAVGGGELGDADRARFSTILKQIGASAKPGDVCKLPAPATAKASIVLAV